MAFAISSDPVLQVAVLLVWLVAALDLGLLLLLLGMRLGLLWQQQRQQQFLKLWEPLLLESLMGMPQQFPKLRRSESFFLLNLWNYLHESLQGDLRKALNQVGYDLQIHLIAQHFLNHRSSHRKLIAITTLGNLQDRTAWFRLQKLAASANPFISLAAAQALVSLDAAAAIPFLVPLICDRQDWSVSKVACLLKEAGVATVAGPLAAALPHVPQADVPRLVRYLDVFQVGTALPAVRQVLPMLTDEEAIASCLRFLSQIGDGQDLPMLRTYLSHPNWYVRLHAVRALGKLGVPGDETRITALLRDSEWWVRYRAAQALAELPFMKVTDLKDLQEQEQDAITREILVEIIEQRQRSGLWNLTRFS